MTQETPIEADTREFESVQPDLIEGLKGVKFLDQSSGLRMKYIYANADHWTAGWILYWHNGQSSWVTLRKATEDDIQRISAAVVVAHHSEEDAA